MGLINRLNPPHMRCAVPKPSREQAMSEETLRDTCRAEVTTAGRLLSEVGGSLQLMRKLVVKYEDTIVKDPDFTSKLESTLKVASYIIPGEH